MGLGVMPADGTHDPTSAIQQHRFRWTDRSKQQHMFSTFVTLTSTGPGGTFFKCRHNKPSPDRCTPPFPSFKFRSKTERTG